MHPAVESRFDERRGCGYRKVGGIYMMSDGPGSDCGRLPLPLTTCPCCGGGIKLARGWTWVDGDRLLAQAPPCSFEKCRPSCPANGKNQIGMAGLLRIGEKHYPTPHSFEREAERMGISRRVGTVPKGFVVGKTWVLLAHAKAVPDESGEYIPGIFRMFQPSRLEIVVSGGESDEQIEDYLRRGLTPVRVFNVAEEDGETGAGADEED